MRSLRQHLHLSPQLWLRLSLIIGLLLLSGALSFKASPRQIILITMLPFGIGMVLAFLRWPSLGLLVTAVVGLFVPYLGPSGLNVTMLMIALLLGLWLFDMVGRQHQIQFAPSRSVWPLLAFVIASVISFGVGQLPWFTFALHAPLGAQLGGLAVVVLSAGIFLLMANQVRDLVWLRRITWAFLIVGSLTVLFRSILPSFGIQGGGIFLSVGTVFYIWLVGMAFSQAMFNKDLDRRWRVALGGLVLITLYVLFVMKFDDKSGWLSCFVCIAAIIAARSWRVGLVIVGFGALLAFLMWAGIVGTDEYSVSTRMDAWTIMAQIIKYSPLLGFGFANYYWYTPLFPIRGYAVSFNSHNNYLDIIAQTGLVGLVCFLCFMAVIAWLAWRLRNQVPAGFAQAYVYAAVGGIAGMLVAAMLGDWVLPFFYNIGLNGFRSSAYGWLFLGGLVAIEQMIIGKNLPAATK
jgi:O-antigen ligase